LVGVAANPGPVGPLGAPLAFQAGAVARPLRVPAKDASKEAKAELGQQEKRITDVVRAEARKRAPQFATLVLDGLAPAGLLPVGGAHPVPLALTVSGHWFSVASKPQYLPFEIVQNELREAMELNLATRWTHETMVAVRKSVERHRGNGREIGMALDLLARQGYRFTVQETKDFVNRYTVD